MPPVWSWGGSEPCVHPQFSGPSPLSNFGCSPKPGQVQDPMPQLRMGLVGFYSSHPERSPAAPWCLDLLGQPEISQENVPGPGFKH
jgi:hypothetical protein